MLCQLRGKIFSQQTLSHAMNICTFQDYQNRIDIQIEALKYLFEHQKKIRNCPNLFEISFAILKKIQAQKNIEYTREMIDIISRAFPKHRARLLNFLRQEDTKQTPPSTAPAKRTVYSDSQNVHNSEINKSVIKSAETLYSKYKDIINIENGNSEYRKSCMENIRKELVLKYPDRLELINSSMEYIQNNTSYFGDQKITLEDAFLSVWLWITNHKDLSELQNRVLEEFKEMKGQCTTGHIARLISIIQGFTEDDNLCIRISEKDRLQSMIYHYLNKELQTCQDSKILDGMLDFNEDYKNFIKAKISLKFNDSDTTVKQIVNSFAKNKIFEV